MRTSRPLVSSRYMIFHTEYLTFHTKTKREYINLTGEVNARWSRAASPME